MAKYEYKYVQYGASGRSKVEGHINEMAADGWRVISFALESNGLDSERAVFERELPEERPHSLTMQMYDPANAPEAVSDEFLSYHDPDTGEEIVLPVRKERVFAVSLLVGIAKHLIGTSGAFLAMSAIVEEINKMRGSELDGKTVAELEIVLTRGSEDIIHRRDAGGEAFFAAKVPSPVGETKTDNRDPILSRSMADKSTAMLNAVAHHLYSEYKDEWATKADLTIFMNKNFVFDVQCKNDVFSRLELLDCVINRYDTSIQMRRYKFDIHSKVFD